VLERSRVITSSRGSNSLVMVDSMCIRERM
jgi:hypothetical protein